MSHYFLFFGFTLRHLQIFMRFLQFGACHLGAQSNLLTSVYLLACFSVEAIILHSAHAVDLFLVSLDVCLLVCTLLMFRDHQV